MAGRGADEAAEALALAALVWLAARPEDAGTFLAAAGADPAALRARAAEPEFLGFVLDFLLADEALLVAFCAETGRGFEAPLRARARLPGGEAPHWT